MSIEIALLADRPELIGQLVAVYEQQMPGWYGPGGRGDALADLQARAQTGALPLGMVAAVDGLAVGTCALGPVSMSRPAPFGAWLLGLWVAPSHRRQGIALSLVLAAARQAAALKIPEVRAGTTTAAGVFVRAGWRPLEPTMHEGAMTQIFSIAP